jgi:hypothetical protein
MEKLIPMTDFVLEQYSFDEQLYRDTLKNIVNYANFLKQPLTLGMFVPCDEDGKPLEEIKDQEYPNNVEYSEEIEQYDKARERLLFEGFNYDEEDDVVFYFDKSNHYNQIDLSEYDHTIEDLVDLNLPLTETAKKQIL